MNELIIKEFDKLLLYIQSLSDNITNEKEKIANKFKLKNIKNALNIIKKYPKVITLENINEFKMPGIGKGTINRITEILNNGSLEELNNYQIDEKESIINELETIVGIGRATALEMIKNGIKSINDLKNKIKNNEYAVNDKVALGIKYHNKFFGNIPRKEIELIKKILDNIIKKYNKNLDEKEEYILEICGSYRRQKPTSGDIDILFSKKIDYTNDNYLLTLVNDLKKNIRANNNNPLITDDLTDKNFDTKYMGFIKYKDNPFRRIDIRYVDWKSYYTALLYFTGSAENNQYMRKIAHNLGYKLSEYSLLQIDKNKIIKIKSEEDVFKKLKLEYLEPKLR